MRGSTELVLGLADLRRDDIAVAGGKGANLGELVAAGLPVPAGFVLTTQAYRTFVDANGIDLSGPPTGVREEFSRGRIPDEILRPLLQAYADLGDADDDADVPVAVRSSATAEDLADASFAGQQESYLNVRGPAELERAVIDCWASLWGDRAVDYRSRQQVDGDAVALAVVVQVMVEADASGVMFTADPATGRRDESVISAAWGLGESVVGGTVDADQLVLAAGAVRSRRTGDKAVRTVYADAGTAELPVPPALRNQPVLDDAAAIELAALGARASAHFGAPQDLEWVRARDGSFAVVQSRPITALPEPAGPVPDRWPVPVPRSMYFRASIVEQLPDPLSPLFAALMATAVPESLRAMINDVAGQSLVAVEDVGFPTINGYAYYRYADAAMIKMLRATPGLLYRMFGHGLMSVVEEWRQVAHPRYAAIVTHWRSRDLSALSKAELLVGIGELVGAGTRYYTSVQAIIPLAATSELLFTRFYELLVRRPGDPPATGFLLGFDSAPILAEKSLYDLAVWTATVPGLAGLRDVPTAEISAAVVSGDAPTGVADSDWGPWRRRFSDHLGRYGHAVYNLDPVNPVPADDPAPLLESVRSTLRGVGRDPYQRQRRSVERRVGLTAATLGRLDPVRARVFAALLRWAQAVGPVREDALADVGLGWPRLRELAAELGRRLVEAGVLTAADDVHWLEPSELEPGRLSDATEVVAARKERWRGRRRANPPLLLPEVPWLTWMRSMMPAASISQSGNEIRGIAGSGGRASGVARVLAGPQDFGRLQPGEILVASITTPAWTPLFAIAGGVVTDVGGPLSHSSIVAREYGIPAVLGTGVATRSIPDGSRVELDGDRGTVRKLE